MLLSTLPDLPGCTFEIRGMVVAHTHGSHMSKHGPGKIIDSLIEQARALGADGIVDIKTVIGGDYGHCVMTGTAVRTLRGR